MKKHDKNNPHPYLMGIPEPSREDGRDAAIATMTDLAVDYVERWRRKHKRRRTNEQEAEEMVADCLFATVLTVDRWMGGDDCLGGRLQVEWHWACHHVAYPRRKRPGAETDLELDLQNHAEDNAPAGPEPRDRVDEFLLQAVREELDGTAPPGSWAGLTEAQRVRQRVSNHFGRRNVTQKDVRRRAGRLLGEEDA